MKPPHLNPLPRRGEESFEHPIRGYAKVSSQKRVLAVALISKTVFHESAVDSAFDSLLVFPGGIF
jgi:hypothetical protein